MNRSDYYEIMKARAREVRAKHNITSPRVLRGDLRRVYKAEGITKIDYWPFKKGLRGAYFIDEVGPTVVLAESLPEDPMVFTMAHELKHHLEDRGFPLSACDIKRIDSEPIEIGAEIFAAEFIFPEADFTRKLEDLGVDLGECTPKHIVELKRETATTLSYAGIVKRAERLGFACGDSLQNIQWKKLEETIYGPPLYKIIQRRRKARVG